MADELFGEVLHKYTRAQALEDGVLIDATTTAKEAGLRFPVALTSRLYHEVITPDPRAEGQDIDGRLWDCLYMLTMAIKGMLPSRKEAGPGPCQTVYYRCYFVMKRAQKRLVELKAIRGPGDDMEPTITLMLVDED